MQMHSDTPSMSREDKMAKMQSMREDNKQKIEAVLTDDQKQKFEARPGQNAAAPPGVRWAAAQ